MKKIFLLILIIFFNKLFAQINLQNGSATYSIPVFNWQDDRSRLDIGIAFNYNSGNGLRTGDIASNVGQGWSLAAGGAIYRMQVGLPDDQYPREGGIGDITKYPPGYLFSYSGTNPEQGCPNKLTTYPIFKKKHQIYKNLNSYEADKELDYFSFQFNGKTGIFILDKNSQTGVSLGDSKMKITYLLSDMTGQGIRTRISSFKIHDENGVIYTFSALSLNKTLLTYNYDPYNNNAVNHTPKFDNGGVYHERGFENNTYIVNPYVVDSWYLTSIEDALTNRTISFNYSTQSLNNTYSGSSLTYFASSNHIVIADNYSYTKTPRLNSIVIPDGHSINFNYKTESRADLPGDHALSSIDITYNGRYVSKFQINTSYLVLNRLTNKFTNEFAKKSARLYLTSIVKFGVDLAGFNEPYVFDYHVGSSAVGDYVPPAFSLLKDIWGYYNGDASATYGGTSINPTNYYASYEKLNFEQLKGLCYIRSGTSSSQPVLNIKNGYAKNGLLKEIKLPTGGHIEYAYEQNYGMVGSDYTMYGGVHVSTIKIFNGVNCTDPLVTNYSYTNESNQSSLWGIELPKNKFTSTSFYEPESKHWIWDIWKGNLFGSCKYRFMYPGIQMREQKPGFFQDKAAMLEVLSVVLGTISTVTTILDIISVISGASTATVVGVIVAAVASIVSLVLSCTHNYTQGPNANDIYYNMDLNMTNPLPTQFRRVVATPGDGSSGKTVYTFTSDVDYAVWEPTNESLSRVQRVAYWAYGLPLKTTNYDASGNKVNETENVYSFTNAKRSFTSTTTKAFPSCKCLVNYSRSFRNDSWEGNPETYVTTSNSEMKVKIYDIFSGRTELITTLERTYQAGTSTFLETKTNYTYNPINYQVSRTETIESNADVINCTDITYSCDYSTAIFTSLQNANLLNIPVTKKTSIKKYEVDISGYYTEILGETATEFITLSNGDIKPEKVLVKRTSNPVELSSWVSYSPTSSNTDFKQVQLFAYDNNGYLKGVKDEGNRMITNFYDYNNKFITATVINAMYPNHVSAYTSFETSSLGNWTLSGTAAYVNNGVTGNRCFQLSSETNSIFINTGSSGAEGYYRLSFWSSTSTVTVTSTISRLILSEPTINGFTYYEYEVSGNTVTLAGNGLIDELRFYPTGSRMKTMAYDELIGKQAECDENNRITYYEYDEFGRIRFIKDHFKNIVKMYEYNQRKSSCTPTYTNKLINEIFTRDNCGTGYYGTDVVYTIPAGKYTSTISQLDADLKAEAELNTYGQQEANTNGQCLPYYYNAAVSQNFIPESCEDGYKPSPLYVTYTVPAAKYASKISQADADQKAAYDIAVNGQFYANANANCVINTDPVWQANDPAETACGTGTQLGHKLIRMTDINPNSPTYNTQQWIDVGEDHATCPLPTCSTSTCTGVQNKCVFGVCEAGIIIHTGSTTISGQTYCVYHYEWSDGSWSGDYYTPASSPYECLSSD